MFFLTDAISIDDKFHAKPAFASDDKFKQNIGCDIVKISNKFQYGFSIYNNAQYDDDDDDHDCNNSNIVIDAFNIRGNILQSTLERCMLGLNASIITPLIWLVSSDNNLFAFTAECEEYKTAIKNDYKYIDVDEIPLYSKIIISNGLEVHLLSKHGVDIDMLRYNGNIKPSIISYMKDDDSIGTTDKDDSGNIIYYDASDKLKNNVISTLSTKFIDFSSGSATIYVENKFRNAVTDDLNLYKPYVVHEHNMTSEYVYYIPELNGYFTKFGTTIYTIDISTSYTINENDIYLLKNGKAHKMSPKTFYNYSKNLLMYSIKSIEYK